MSSSLLHLLIFYRPFDFHVPPQPPPTPPPHLSLSPFLLVFVLSCYHSQPICTSLLSSSVQHHRESHRLSRVKRILENITMVYSSFECGAQYSTIESGSVICLLLIVQHLELPGDEISLIFWIKKKMVILVYLMCPYVFPGGPLETVPNLSLEIIHHLYCPY